MLIRILFFLAVIASLTVFYNVTKNQSLPRPSGLFSPQPIAYGIGDVDPRFKLSKDEVAYLALEATQIWEQGTAQSLFVYDPQAKLKIHLIYDERQEKALYVDEMNANMTKKSDELDAFNQKLTRQLENLTQRRDQLEADYKHVRNEQAAWRRIEFEDSANLQRLQQQEQQLKQQRQQLSNEFDTYHLNVNLYNQQVDAFNQYALQARQYNQSSPSRLFHKGTFSGDRIDVYQFSSKNDLKVTLAHEFGHALGMDHHQDAKGLMYPSMSEQNIDDFELRPADLLLFEQRE